MQTFCAIFILEIFQQIFVFRVTGRKYQEECQEESNPLSQEGYQVCELINFIRNVLDFINHHNLVNIFAELEMLEYMAELVSLNFRCRTQKITYLCNRYNLPDQFVSFISIKQMVLISHHQITQINYLTAPVRQQLNLQITPHFKELI